MNKLGEFKNTTSLTDNGLWSLNFRTKEFKWLEAVSEKISEHSTTEDKLESWLNCICDEDRDRLLKEIRMQIESNQKHFSVEYKIKIGSLTKWMKSDISLKHSPNGKKPDTIYGYQYEIDNYKTSLKLVQKSNQRLKYLIDNISGAILLEDEHNKIFFINSEFLNWFELQESTYDLIGNDFWETINQIAPVVENPSEFINSIKAVKKLKRKTSGHQFKLKNGRIVEQEFIPILIGKAQEGNIWIFRDITELKQNEENLKFRLNFEDIILKLSSKFINININNIDNAIIETLSMIGSFIKADRSYVFLFSDDKLKMSNTHEWVNKNVPEEKDNLQNIPTGLFPWWIKKISDSEIINYSSIEDMPGEAHKEKRMLEMQNIKSIVVLPIELNNVVIGYLGFDSVSAKRIWPADSIKLLKVAGDVISNALNRKQNEEALIKSENQYKSVLSNIKETIFQLNNENKIEFISRAWTIITGYKIEDTIGKCFTEFIHHNDLTKFSIKSDSNEYSVFEVRISTADNEYKWVEIITRKLNDEIGNIAGTTGVLKDISEHKKAQDKIRQLSKAVETTQTATLLLDASGSIIYVNQGLLKIGKYKSNKQLIGKNIYDLTNNGGKYKLRNEILPSLKNGINWNGELELLRSNGQPFHAELVCSNVEEDSENTRLIVVNFFDVTDRKLAEEETKNALEKERELNLLKTKFISMVSHEFRTPLSAILSSSELLKFYWNECDEEKRNKLFGKISSSINNLVAILDDVTEISRSDYGKSKLKKELLPVSEFIANLINEIKIGDANSPNIIVDDHLEEAPFLTDRNLLRQIFHNLISNAVKYTPKHKCVHISLSIISSSLILKIKDEGIGIPLKDQKTLFEPFIRGTNTEDIRGTGLGLSIVKSALSKLNGKINFNSNEGGSEFRVEIPKL